jgi:hypothetical protein
MPDQDRAHPGNVPASPPTASQQRPRPARDLTRSPWVPVIVVLASLILWEFCRA